MAIIIENQTRCPLCNDVLNKSRKYILVPPLISNKLDDLFIFSDTGVHVDCLDKSPIKENLFKQINLHDQYLNRMKLMMINYKPNNIIGFNLLTSDEKEPLYKYNYCIFSKQELLAWKELDIFRNLVCIYLAEKKWLGLNQFNYLEYLLKSLHSITQTPTNDL